MSVQEISVCKVICADLDRSVAFYELLGFAPLAPAGKTDGTVVPQLYGVAATGLRTRMMGRPDTPKSMRIELIEWDHQGKRAPGPSAPGAGMLGLRSNDLKDDYQRLRDQGVEFVSEPVSFSSAAGVTWVVHVRDPDGFNLQLLQFVKASA
jgi:catechol 2,3-dioxygenase-like lactoylglutathione lyase family enzyme